MRHIEEEQFEYVRYAFEHDTMHFQIGIDDDEKAKIKAIICAAKANPIENEYPDYLSESATIELFAVTSSIVKRKGGSTHTREKRIYDKKVVAEQQTILRMPIKNENEFSKQYGWLFDRPKHSHELLIESFKRNWDNHMKSHIKYPKKKPIAIFVISYTDVALSAVDKATGNELLYQLSCDKELLDFINDNSELIDYVVFETPFCVEVIKTTVPSDCYKNHLVFKENMIRIATVMHRIKL